MLAGFEQVVQNALESGSYIAGRDELLRIPVVWHILYNTSTEQISRQRIDLEMSYLNQWFSATNEGYDNNDFFGPSVASADELAVSFEFAATDPEGNPTDAVIYVPTNITLCLSNQTDFFLSSQGGSDAWDPNIYMNVYTCELPGNLLGFAALPSTSTSFRDAIIVDPVTVGSSSFA